MAEEIGVKAVFDMSEFNQGLAQYTSGIDRIESSTVDMANSLYDIANASKDSVNSLESIQAAIYDLTDSIYELADSSNDADRALSGLDDESKKTAGGMSALGHAISTGIGVAIGNAISAIPQLIGAFGSLAGQAVSIVADYERLAMSIESLVAKEIMASGSATNMSDALSQASGPARELLSWIQQLAVESPFTQEGVAVAFRTALSYGFASDEAQRLTSALIDFAAGTGATEGAMNQVTLALGQIQAKGKLAGQEVLQLVNAGISVDQVLADAFGKSTAEIVDMREKGLIPADAAIKAIVESLERDFGGAARRQSETFAGLISTFEDVKEVGLREFFTSAFEAAKPALQDIMAILSSPDFVNSLRNLGQQFGDFVAAAFDWGMNLAISFANGISAGVGYIVSAVNYIGDIIASWMQPGSPPKFLRDLDQWGTDAMDTYMKGWTQADFGVFDDLSNQIKRGLEAMVKSGQMQEVDLIPTLLGSQTSIAKAIDELKTTGSVSQQTFEEITKASGAAGVEVESLVKAYMNLSKATQGVASANAALAAQDEKIAEIENELATATIPGLAYNEKFLQLQREKSRRTQLAAIVEERKQQESGAKSAINDEKAILERKRQTAELIQEQADLLNKQKAEEEKAAAARNKAERDYKFGLADTAEKISMIREELDATQEGSIEYYRLLSQLDSLQQKQAQEQAGAAKNAEKDAADRAKAERDYRYAIGSTGDKLGILRNELANTEQGSVEYYRLLTQIAQLEQSEANKAGKEAAAAAKAGQSEAEKAAEAQWKYNYSIADTAGKMAMLKEKLASTAEGSAEYYNILTQIAALERSGGGAGGFAASAGAGLGGLTSALGEVSDSAIEFQTKIGDVVKSVGEIGASFTRARDSVTTAIDSIKGKFGSFDLSTTETGKTIEGVFDTIYKIIVENVGPSIMELIDTLGGAFSGLGITWEDVGSILGAVMTVVGGVIVAAIGIIIAIIDSLIVIATTLYETFAETLGFLGAAWESLWGVIENVVNAIQAAIKGDWSAAMKYMQAAGQDAWNVLKNAFSAAWAFVSGMLDAFIKGVKEFIGTIVDFFTELYNKLVGGSIIPDMVEGIIGWFQTLYDKGAQLIGDIKTFIENTWTTIKEKIPEYWAAITTALDTAIRAIPGKLSEAINTVIQIGKDMVTKIGEGITSTWDSVVDAAIQAAVKAMSLAQGAIDALKSFGGSMVSSIKIGVENAWDNISGAMNWLIENALPIGESAMTALGGIGTAIVNAIKKAILASGGIAEALRNVVVNGINEVIDTINSLIDSLNAILMIDLPKLPRLASGVMNFSGGMAMVGENGPEIVYIPQGANVYPTNSQVPQASYAMTTNNVSNQIFNLNINGDFSDGIQSQASDALRELQVSALLRR